MIRTMALAAALALAALLAACSDSGESDAPPPETGSLKLQPITYPDIEAEGLYGASCAYAAGQSMAPVVIAMTDQAVIKIDGKIERLTLDPQCKEVKAGTGSRYLSADRVLDLAVTGEGALAGYEAVHYNGTVRLTDAEGRVLYSTSGAVQCGS